MKDARGCVRKSDRIIYTYANYKPTLPVDTSEQLACTEAVQ